MTNLKLFGNPACQPCQMVKQRFEAEGIIYEYIDTYEQPEVAGQYGIMSTPVLIIDEDERIIGGDNIKNNIERFK